MTNFCDFFKLTFWFRMINCGNSSKKFKMFLSISGTWSQLTSTPNTGPNCLLTIQVYLGGDKYSLLLRCLKPDFSLYRSVGGSEKFELYLPILYGTKNIRWYHQYKFLHFLSDCNWTGLVYELVFDYQIQ